MCKAYILRFCCGHGVLMSLEPCNRGPCPVLKLSGNKLPQQPFKCYNCQHKTSISTTTSTSPRSSIYSRGHPASCRSSRSNSSRSSQDSLSTSSSGSDLPTITELPRTQSMPSHPLPGVAVQPSGCTQLWSKNPFSNSTSSRRRSFSFSCNDSSHFATPHYSGLPSHLPHQDHACPPCQLENLRQRADEDAIRTARVEFPNLREEMLVRDGRIWEEWQSRPTLEKYVEEKRTEEREMWLHVTRKWTQDLRKSRVLVSEEDGLGLLG